MILKEYTVIFHNSNTLKSLMPTAGFELHEKKRRAKNKTKTIKQTKIWTSGPVAQRNLLHRNKFSKTNVKIHITN